MFNFLRHLSSSSFPLICDTRASSRAGLSSSCGRYAKTHLEFHPRQPVHALHIPMTMGAIELGPGYMRLMMEKDEIGHPEDTLSTVRAFPHRNKLFSFLISGWSGITYSWQKKHFSTSGIPASWDLSTKEWQKRQSICFTPAWTRWLKGIGCWARPWCRIEAVEEEQDREQECLRHPATDTRA